METIARIIGTVTLIGTFLFWVSVAGSFLYAPLFVTVTALNHVLAVF